MIVELLFSQRKLAGCLKIDITIMKLVLFIF